MCIRDSGSRKERETNALKARAGIEAWFANQILGLRAGYNMKKVQDTSSSACIGASIRVPLSGILLRLDYAAQIFGSDLQDRLAHRISFGLSF